jgi:hypothetical protein
VTVLIRVIPVYRFGADYYRSREKESVHQTE